MLIEMFFLIYIFVVEKKRDFLLATLVNKIAKSVDYSAQKKTNYQFSKSGLARKGSKKPSYRLHDLRT